MLLLICSIFCFNCSVSPPGGDFSDPVTSATLGIVQVSEDSRFSRISLLSQYLLMVEKTPIFFSSRGKLSQSSYYLLFCLSGVLGSG